MSIIIVCVAIIAAMNQFVECLEAFPSDEDLWKFVEPDPYWISNHNDVDYDEGEP